MLACAPLVVPVSPGRMVAAAGALALGCRRAARCSACSWRRGSDRSRTSPGVINVVLFPLLFVSGALYPTAGMPAALRLLARLNPVTYQVDLMRHAFGQPTEFGLGTRRRWCWWRSTVVAFGLTALLFDPEQRFIGARRAGRRRG